jgi:signal transduction histidine kinase
MAACAGCASDGAGWEGKLTGERSISPVSAPGGLNERFAAIIREDRPRILKSFASCLEESYGFIADDPSFIEQALVTASDIIGDVERSVSATEIRIDESHKPNSWDIARAGRGNCLSPADGLGFAVMLLNIVIRALTVHVSAEQELMPCFTLAVQALNESVSRRMQAVAAACAANTLERVHRAEVKERQRIARELHDRVGEVLSVGLRRLDLEELAERDTAGRQPGVGREALVEAMRRLRTVVLDLREPPVANLEKALLRYVHCMRADAEVRLHISGDEAWAPPAVLDEVFLILREAVRNALLHGAPQLVLIGVELDPHELSAWVLDDGCGFAPRSADRGAAGVGLASMRERAALIGGRVAVSSVPGYGTRVELRLPLQEHWPLQGNAEHA